jgi:hypothetical protein
MTLQGKGDALFLDRKRRGDAISREGLANERIGTKFSESWG